MNEISSIHTIALTRFQTLRRQHHQEQQLPEQNDDNSIELPEAIRNFNTGSDYWVRAKANRYKKLIREGHANDLLELARLAPVMATKADPSHWFATAASVRQWERSKDFLQKLRRLYVLAYQVLARIGADRDDTANRMQKFVYKQIWLRRSVERHAAAAQELSHDKPHQSRARLFAYLCNIEGRRLIADSPLPLKLFESTE